MDKETCNRIQKATQAARGLLEQDFENQLSGVFDIRPDGTLAGEPGSHLDAAQQITRTKLVAAVEPALRHYAEQAEGSDRLGRQLFVEEVVLGLAQPMIFADLGYGVDADFPATDFDSPDAPSVYQGRPLTLQQMREAIDWEAGQRE